MTDKVAKHQKFSEAHKTESIYRDFSQVEDPSMSTDGSDMGQNTLQSLEGSFPMILHYMLSELEADGLSHIASWQPNGRCFLVHKHDEFVDVVLRR